MKQKTGIHPNRPKGRANDSNKGRIQELEEELRHRCDGAVAFGAVRGCPPELRQAGLEDALAFESVESGISLFDGLQAHGIELPRPEILNERQIVNKIEEVMVALLELHILLIGFEGMSARQLYGTLWHETLWEGCYVPKKYPGSVTIIDVSHSIPQSEILQHLEEMMRANSIH